VVRVVVGSFAGVVVIVFIEEVADKSLESGTDGFNGLLGLEVLSLNPLVDKRMFFIRLLGG
jgi:urea transporter